MESLSEIQTENTDEAREDAAAEVTETPTAAATTEDQPAEAPAAGPSRSSTVTCKPRACKASAEERPTTPAPITITSG